MQEIFQKLIFTYYAGIMLYAFQSLFRDEAIFSPIFLSSNYYFYLFCSMLQYFAQSLAIKLAV